MNVLKHHNVESVLWIHDHCTEAERFWKLVSGHPETILSSRSALLQKQALEQDLMLDFDLWSTVHSCRGNASVFCPSPFCELHCGGVSSKSHCMKESKTLERKRHYWNGISISAYTVRRFTKGHKAVWGHQGTEATTTKAWACFTLLCQTYSIKLLRLNLHGNIL